MYLQARRQPLQSVFFRVERRRKTKLTVDFLTQINTMASKRSTKGKLSPSTRTALSNISKIAELGNEEEYAAFDIKGVPKYEDVAGKVRPAPTATISILGYQRKGSLPILK